MSISSNLLKTAGIVSLITVPAHLSMGLSELRPRVASNLESQTALTGWYQGSFMFFVFGLNYLRLASVHSFTLLDYLALFGQASLHVFSVFRLRQTPARLINAAAFGAMAAALIFKEGGM